VLGALGYIITFVPGAEFGWFLVVAGLSVAGLFIPKFGYKASAALILILALVSTYDGYRRGVEYRQWVSTHRPSAP
jgi:hypothetical protein